MTSLVWWTAQQIVRTTSQWASDNPAAASLLFVGLQNPKTRGFVVDVIKSVMWRGLRFKGGVIKDIGRSLGARSTVARNTGSAFRSLGRFISRHPVATVAVAYVTLGATSIALAKDADPLTEELQMKGTSSGIGGTGQPNLGSYPILGSGW
jgi:hypothetical protein